MFRAASRPLFRISRTSSARCPTQLLAPWISPSTRLILRLPYSTLPQPSISSTVGKRGWWQRAWFRDDGTPRSKRKGASYALLAILALLPISVILIARSMYEEYAFIAWSLAQCYRTDARYGKVDWDDFDSVVDYFRDLVFVLLVHSPGLKIPRDQVEKAFIDVKSWAKEDPTPSSSESLAVFSKRVFTRTAHDIHFLLDRRSGQTNVKAVAWFMEVIQRPVPTAVEELELVDIGFWAALILRGAMTEWAETVERVRLELESSKADKLKANRVVDQWKAVE